MDTIFFPYGRGPILPDAMSEELEHTNPYMVDDFNPSQSPFSNVNSDELLEELWEEGVNRRFKPPSHSTKNRGNYVRSFVLSNLRIKAKSTRLKVGWNLEALWDTLPLELIISIFEFLHPIDLYHAICATKGIHSACLHMPAFLPSRVDTAAFMEFSDIRYQALKNLAELLHFDLRSTLAKDLDVLNKRFICKTCKFHRQGGLHGHHSMTWRECLNHAKMGSVSSNSEPPHVIMFDVLSEALTTSILALEQPFPPPADANWTCKHCHIWFEPEKRAEVVAHTKTEHGVLKPVEGVDIIYCHTEKTPKRTPPFVGLDEHSNHRCLRCPSPRGLRLWKKNTRPVASHLGQACYPF